VAACIDGGPVRVTLIAGRTGVGRPVVVAVREVEPFRSVIVAAGELTGDDLAACRRMHARDADGIADQSVASITLDVAKVTVEATGPDR
jgi:hypothetical protein